MIFIYSLGDLFSLPHLTTLKVKNVGIKAVDGSAVTSAANTGSNSDLFLQIQRVCSVEYLRVSWMTKALI